MTSRIRRELRIHRALSGLCCLGTVSFIGMGLQSSPQRNLGEITVERINVVEKDGRLRMVISNSEEQHPGSINGKVLALNRKRPAGVIFFNDEGDEDGGLVFDGRGGSANASLTFDQYKQDQTIGLSYADTNGKRVAGLSVWDHADLPLDQFLDKFNDAQKLPEAERPAAMRAIGAQDNGARRVFVGKGNDGAAIVSLADAHGKPRLRMTVDANGAPSIQFLDEAGTVTSQLPPR